MRSLGAHIADVEQVVFAHPALDRNVPVLGVRRPQSRWHREHRGRRDQRLVGKRWRRGPIGIRQVETGTAQLIRLGPGQRADRGLQRSACAIGVAVVEDSIAGAQSGLVVVEGTPRKAHARHKLAIIHSGDSRRHSGVAGEEQPRRRVREDFRFVLRVPRRDPLPQAAGRTGRRPERTAPIGPAESSRTNRWRGMARTRRSHW